MPLGAGQLVERRNDRGDHHIAILVERHGQDRARPVVGNVDLIDAAQSPHPADLDVVAVGQSEKFRAEQFEIGDTIEFGLVGNPGVALAEPDLGPQIERDLNAAVGGGAAERPPVAPLVARERPLDLDEGGWRRHVGALRRAQPDADGHRVARQQACDRGAERKNQDGGAKLGHLEPGCEPLGGSPMRPYFNSFTS